MKSNINLSINYKLLKEVEIYVQEHNTSLENLIEVYLTQLIHAKKKSNIIEMIESLEKTNIDEFGQTNYHAARAFKNGF